MFLPMKRKTPLNHNKVGINTYLPILKEKNKDLCPLIFIVYSVILMGVDYGKDKSFIFWANNGKYGIIARFREDT